MMKLETARIRYESGVVVRRHRVVVGHLFYCHHAEDDDVHFGCVCQCWNLLLKSCQAWKWLICKQSSICAMIRRVFGTYLILPVDVEQIMSILEVLGSLSDIQSEIRS